MYNIEEFDEAKTKVLKYILYKKRTESEVKIKFSKIYKEDLLEDVIEYLKEAKYIDDKEYIEKMINNIKMLKNLSKKEIQYKLMSKGIKKEYIEDYFYENQEELNKYEQKAAYTIYLKKKTSMEPDEIKQYLLKKGYSSENIKKAMEEEI